MTSSVPLATAFEYLGDGATAEFAFPLRFLEVEELAVLVNDAERTIGIHYAVDGAGDPSGGYVTFHDDYIPPSGALVRIGRYTAPKQTVDLKDNERTPADTLEKQLDRLAMAIQDLEGRLTGIEGEIDLAVGPAGPGVPQGGILGEVLRKATNGDYDSSWMPVESLGLQPLDADLTTIAGQDNEDFGLDLLTMDTAEATRVRLREVDTLAKFFAGAGFTYSAGLMQVAAGDTVSVRNGRYCYEVADAGASDEHLAVDGVKYYVTPVGDAIDWRQFGITSGSVSAAAFIKPFLAGFDLGVRKFILPKTAITLDDHVHVTIPNDYGAVSVEHRGQLYFDYVWDWPTVRNERLLRFIGNGVDSIHLDGVWIDGTEMGRYPDTWRLVSGLQIENAPFSTVRGVHLEECFGFGLRVQSCNFVEVSGVDTINCDGQKNTVGPDGEFDNFGDGIYILSCAGAKVRGCRAVTTNGGRGGIVFEALGSTGLPHSGTIENCHVDGYDRNIHIEAPVAEAGAVTIIGGKSLNSSSAGVYVFSACPVVVIGMEFRTTSKISARIMATTVVAYVTGYTIGTRINPIRTIGCIYRENLNPDAVRAIYGGIGGIISEGDIFEAGCGGISTSNSIGPVAIRNPDGRTNNLMDIFNAKRAEISGGTWAGGISLGGSNAFEVVGLTMQRATGQVNCGTIIAQNKRGGIIRNVVFENPETWCIDNARPGSWAGAKPIFEGIVAIKKDSSSTPQVLRYAPSGSPAANDYRSGIPSYVYDEVGATQTEIAPRPT